MRLIGGIAAALVLMAVLIVLGQHYGLLALGWAAEGQQRVQTAMAGAVRAIKAGDPGALWLLTGLCGAYGFLHALGPGHGKVLLGGAALGTDVRPWRIFAIGAAASLAQAGAAILLVLVVLGAFRLTSAHATELAEGTLTLLSRAAVAAIGAVLIWRGLRLLRAAGQGDHHHHHHDHGPDCGCGHDAALKAGSLTTAREAAAMILSIAARPCTGAIFLLAVAWRFGIPGAGVLGVLAMGVGTAALNALAIGGGLLGRRLAGLGHRVGGHGRLAGVLQVAAGGAMAGLAALAMV
ncbi:nickel/cobalt transporter [Falsirhodobacter algicola]|uniref:Nickel/cobalt efflux system n=1 Tax=Falsirhodobacter algicola TaxID=2692330 RepID=A0A8J8SM44_9RHOB|nr:hypothetical protein [Falsirhodobacter algicola]QUS37079.1 hypothetical protein GR316_11860 [Falsirhodobacter algicola]